MAVYPIQRTAGHFTVCFLTSYKLLLCKAKSD